MVRRQSAVFSTLALAALVLAFLVSCADKEPQQRAAFVNFLQTRIVAAKSVALTPLSDAEKKSFGEYTDHYALLLNFQTKLAEATAKNTSGMLALNKLESLDAIAKERRPLEKAAREAQKLHDAITDLYKDTDKAKKRLKLPPDMAGVYTAAFDKTVRVPAETSAATFSAAAGTFNAILELLDFVDANSKDLEITGQDIKVKNPALQKGLDERMGAVQEQSRLLKVAYAAQIKAMMQ